MPRSRRWLDAENNSQMLSGGIVGEAARDEVIGEMVPVNGIERCIWG